MKKLKDFVKKGITFEEKIQIIEAYEEDRGSSGEFVYDLDLQSDAWAWVELYGIKNLYACRKLTRFWLGGYNFKCGEEGNKPSAFGLHANNIDYHLDHFIDEIEDIIECRDIKDLNGCYYNLVDFQSYFNSKKPVKYKWVAFSDDHSFEDDSLGTFDNVVDCYNNMREFAIAKMKWNTEYDDIDVDFIKYDVEFYKDRIIHKSYSGTYMYKIVDADTIIDAEYISAFIKQISDYNK